MRRLCGLFFAMLLTMTALGAWGQNGHRIVAEIAEGLLSDSARAAVRQILGGDSLAKVSNWADEIRSDDSWGCASPFHFATIPPDSQYPVADLSEWKNGDAVRAVFFTAQVLADREAGNEARRDALRFLVHVVGDLHQPLHVGQGCDRGGNDLVILWFDEEKRFHSVLDEGILESAGLSYTEYVRFLGLPAGEQAAEIAAAGPATWIVEAQSLQPELYRCDIADRCPCYCGDCADGRSRFGGCTSVGTCQLQIRGPVRLSYSYRARVAPLVDRQLVKGGLRLAALLNAIFAEEPGLPASYRELHTQLQQIEGWDSALGSCFSRTE